MRRNKIFEKVLNNARKSEKTISIYVKNGVRMNGNVLQVDGNVVIIQDNDTQAINMVMVDAISTVTGLDRATICPATW